MWGPLSIKKYHQLLYMLLCAKVTMSISSILGLLKSYEFQEQNKSTKYKKKFKPDHLWSCHLENYYGNAFCNSDHHGTDQSNVFISLKSPVESFFCENYFHHQQERTGEYTAFLLMTFPSETNRPFQVFWMYQ